MSICSCVLQYRLSLRTKRREIGKVVEGCIIGMELLEAIYEALRRSILEDNGTQRNFGRWNSIESSWTRFRYHRVYPAADLPGRQPLCPGRGIGHRPGRMDVQPLL